MNAIILTYIRTYVGIHVHSGVAKHEQHLLYTPPCWIPSGFDVSSFYFIGCCFPPSHHQTNSAGRDGREVPATNATYTYRPLCAHTRTDETRARSVRNELCCLSTSSCKGRTVAIMFLQFVGSGLLLDLLLASVMEYVDLVGIYDLIGLESPVT